MDQGASHGFLLFSQLQLLVIAKGNGCWMGGRFPIMAIMVIMEIMGLWHRVAIMVVVVIMETYAT
jgi:hypothetical protein